MNRDLIIDKFAEATIVGLKPSSQCLKTLEQIDRFDIDDFLKWLTEEKMKTVGGALLMEYLNR